MLKKFQKKFLSAAVCGLLSGAAWMIPAASARADSFTVINTRGSQEVSEISRLYLDGKLVATFRLGHGNEREVRKIDLPPGSGPDHRYTLCGEITVYKSDGINTETHIVSSSGTLFSPSDHVFEAFATAGFTDFFLFDQNSPGSSEHTPGTRGKCDIPIS